MLVTVREVLINFVEAALFVAFLCLCLNPRGKGKWLPVLKWLPLLISVPVSYLVYVVNHAHLPFTTQLPLFLAMNVLIAVSLFKGRIWDRILCGCVGAMVPAAANNLLIIAFTLLSSTPVYQAAIAPASPEVFRLIAQSAYLLLCGALYWYMYRTHKAFINLPARETALLTISFLVCILQSALAQQVGMDPNLSAYYGRFVSYLLVSSSGFVFFIIWLQLTLRLHTRKHVLEMEQQQLASERAHLADMQGSYLALRNWRHDYHNHLSIINYYVEEGEWDSLREYLGELNQQLPILPMAVNTDNSVFNALINTKMLLAIQAGVDLEVEADLPEFLPLDDVSFCALLGNLLDNALEATKRLPAESKPWIRVSAQLSNHVFELHVANSTDGTYHFLRNRLLSRKEEPNHGIGLWRVQQIVQSVGGKLSLTPERDVFEALVRIPCSARRGA